jgi:hypothetical protein
VRVHVCVHLHFGRCFVLFGVHRVVVLLLGLGLGGRGGGGVEGKAFGGRDDA